MGIENKSLPRFKAIPLDVEELGKQTLDAAYTVHTALGPGLLESVYESCLVYELKRLGLAIEAQVTVPIKYQDVYIETAFKLDIWVERKVILELKAVETLIPLYKAQTITYLKMTGCRLAYLMNFNVPRFKDGFQRIVH